jgi:protein-disulfide isomerase
MAHEKTRSIVEIVTNVCLAAAAVAVVWRLVLAPAPVPAPQALAGQRQAPSGPLVENIEDKGLSAGLTGANRKGNTDAPVVLIEFSDYECPYCGQYARDTFAAIDKDFVATGKVQYVMKNFPLESIHKSAVKAAQAAECAGVQARYWEMHDWLFTHQKELAASPWTGQAPALRLNAATFEQCLDGMMADRVKADQAEGSKLGVQATPTFFVGRVMNDGGVSLVSSIRGAQPYSVFEDALTKALKGYDKSE